MTSPIMTVSVYVETSFQLNILSERRTDLSDKTYRGTVRE